MKVGVPLQRDESCPSSKLTAHDYTPTDKVASQSTTKVAFASELFVSGPLLHDFR